MMSALAGIRIHRRFLLPWNALPTSLTTVPFVNQRAGALTKHRPAIFNVAIPRSEDLIRPQPESQAHSRCSK